MTAQTVPTESTLAEIDRLLRIDTTSRDSNLPLIDLVAKLLRDLGVEPQIIPSTDGAKANLLATFPASDGTVTGGIVLSGHTDVVPVDGQDWHSDPFVPEIRDGLLYGRGTADMKSFIGIVLDRLPRIAAASLSEPIHLALSYDEEVGCLGAVSLVEAISAAGLAPRGCVVGEPTSMRVVRGHKSINVLRADFHGVAAHSSLTPDGVNAIGYAAELVRFVERAAADFRDAGPRDEHYVVPYTTASVNRIDGGIAVNTIPAECSVMFEFRSVAAHDAAALTERFRAEVARLSDRMAEQNPGARAEFSIVASAPGVDTPDDAAIVALAAGWGAEPSADKVTFGTEAGLFAQAGIPTVVCGPGDIAQAHAPDEFIALEQIALGESFLDALITDLTAG